MFQHKEQIVENQASRLHLMLSSFVTYLQKERPEVISLQAGFGLTMCGVVSLFGISLAASWMYAIALGCSVYMYESRTKIAAFERPSVHQHPLIRAVAWLGVAYMNFGPALSIIPCGMLSMAALRVFAGTYQGRKNNPILPTSTSDSSDYRPPEYRPPVVNLL